MNMNIKILKGGLSLIRKINFRMSFKRYKMFSTTTINNITPATVTLNSSSTLSQKIEKIKNNLNLGVVRRDDYLIYLKYTQDYFQNHQKDIKLEEKRTIQKDFMKNLELAINKSVITTSTVAEILPSLLSVSSRLNINSLAFWQLLNKVFTDVFHKLGPNLIFDILNNLNLYYPENSNVIALKNNYFKNLSRDKVLNFNFETVINYLKAFVGLHENQKLVDDIQQLIAVLLAGNDNKINQLEVFEHLINVFEYYYNGEKINFNTLLVLLLPNIIKDFNNLHNENKLNCLKIYHQFAMSNPSAVSEVADLANKAGKYFSQNLSNYTVNESADLVKIYTELNTGSHELFLNLEKHIGTNIDKLDSNQIYPVFSNFVNSKKFREKFPLLLQKKVNDQKLEINFSDLCKIIKIYTDLNTTNLYIYDKLHSYFLNTLQFFSLKELSNLIYAYSYNPAINQNKINQILEKAESFVLSGLEKISENNNSNSNSDGNIIHILYAYTHSNNSKFYQNIIDRLSSLILPNIERLSTIKDINLLIKSLEKLGLAANNLERFETPIKNNSSKFTHEDLTELSASIKRINPLSKNLIELIDSKLGK